MPHLIKQLGKTVSFRLFHTLDRFGIHVLPKHYYTPVSDYAWLAANHDLWARRHLMAGIIWNLDEQLLWIATTSGNYVHEFPLRDHDRQFQSAGPGYGPIESQFLYAFVRSQRPARIIEIGSGVSTKIMLHAISQNAADGQAQPQLTCIEPYPSGALTSARNITLLPKLCQEVPLSLFQTLQDGDLLFIDSSHAVKTGSDVNRIYLDILPLLNPGVIVQIHDIYLPYLYSPEILTDYFAWQETTLVTALLTYNKHMRVLASMSALHYDRSSQLRELFPEYHPGRLSQDGIGREAGAHFPSSLWLQTC